MSDKQAIMSLTNGIIRHLSHCEDEQFVKYVLNRIQAGVEFDVNEMNEACNEE